MNFRRLVSAVAALAVAGTMCAGLAVTASAETPDGYTTLYEKNVTYGDDNIWTSEAMAEWTQTDTSTAALILDVPTSADDTGTHYGIYYYPTKPGTGYSATKTFDISDNALVNYDIDWYFYNSVSNSSNYEYLQLGSNIVLGYFSSYYVYISYDGAATWESTSLVYNKAGGITNVNCTIDTATNTIVSLKYANTEVSGAANTILSSDATYDSVTLGFHRGGATGSWNIGNGIQNITVSQKEQTVTPISCNIYYQLDGTNVAIVPFATVVGGTISADASVEGTEEGYTDTVFYATVDVTDEQYIKTATSGADNDLYIPVRAEYTYNIDVVNSLTGESLYTSTVAESVDSFTYAYPLYLTEADGTVTAKCTETTYTMTKTPSEDVVYDSEADTYTATYELGYENYEGTAYFIEHENISSANSVSSSILSSGAGTRVIASPTTGVTVQEDGVYTITIPAFCRNTRNMNIYITVYKNGTDDDSLIYTSENIGATDTDGDGTYDVQGYSQSGPYVVTATGIELSANDVIYVSGTVGEALADYVLVEKLDPEIIAAAATTTAGEDVAADDGTTLTGIGDDETVTAVTTGIDDNTYGKITDGKTITTIYARIENATSGTPTITVTTEDETITSDEWQPVTGTNVYFAQLIGDPSKFTSVTIKYTGADDAPVTLPTTAGATE